MNYSYNLRSSTSKGTMLSEEIKSYLDNLVKPLVKSEELTTQLETFKKEMSGKMEELEKKLGEKDMIIERLESQLKVTQNALNLVLAKSDDVEQYTRRYSVRIHGLPVKQDENIVEVVKECYKEMNLEFKNDDIDRMHRVGFKKYDATKKEHLQSVIVKFRNWDARSRFYRARPKIVKEAKGKGKWKPTQHRKFTVSVDLTK